MSEMDFTFVMAVYNNLDLTINCYQRIRKIYPITKIVISSGGSHDKTKEFVSLIQDDNLIFTHCDNKISFSETYNNGIKLVTTEKLVLIHNDMVIGENFLENLNKLLEEKMILSYTTVEPPIFVNHRRPGKVIENFGNSFENFNQELFNQYVEKNKDKCELYDGAVFFLSTYKKSFDDFGYFDGFSFDPCFCEDDDLLIRARQKGYTFKTTECAITYHFVSQTSRFSEEFIDKRFQIEYNSNRNFIRKWGTSISSFQEIQYWLIDDFKYNKQNVGLIINNSTKEDYYILGNLEPYFDKIQCDGTAWMIYLNMESGNTKYDLNNKFGGVDECRIVIKVPNKLSNEHLTIINRLGLVLNEIQKGEYVWGDISILVK